MIIIADSGSTKTEWLVLDNEYNEIKQFKTEGINPYYQSDAQLNEVFGSASFADWTKESGTLYFYGAGCSISENTFRLRRAFERQFSGFDAIVEHDLLGASRSLYGNEAGYVGILGTGSNACFYDGVSVSEAATNLGFWLGDEGSGGYLCKKFIVDFFHKELPDKLSENFQKAYNISRDDLLEAVYKKPFPNRWFASFMPFLATQVEHDYIKGLVWHAFEAFFKYNVEQMEPKAGFPISFIGSVANYFGEALKAVAEHRGYHVHKIEKSAIPGLFAYHKQHPEI
jgi:N-acetylglucosamine kinase-like BadF-type ATPase